jgi:hypothetical protein
VSGDFIDPATETSLCDFCTKRFFMERGEEFPPPPSCPHPAGEDRPIDLGGGNFAEECPGPRISSLSIHLLSLFDILSSFGILSISYSDRIKMPLFLLRSLLLIEREYRLTSQSGK